MAPIKRILNPKIKPILDSSFSTRSYSIHNRIAILSLALTAGSLCTKSRELGTRSPTAASYSSTPFTKRLRILVTQTVATHARPQAFYNPRLHPLQHIQHVHNPNRGTATCVTINNARKRNAAHHEDQQHPVGLLASLCGTRMQIHTYTTSFYYRALLL